MPICTKHLLQFKTMMVELGVPLVEEKTKGDPARLGTGLIQLT